MSPITVAPIDISQVPEINSQAQLTLSETRKLEIKTQDQYAMAQQARKDINTRIKMLEAKRKSITAPLTEAKNNVMDLFREPINKLTEARDIADTLLIAYDEEQEKKRREEQARLEREAEKKRQEAQRKAEEARIAGNEAKAEKYEEKAANVVAPVIAPMAQKVEGVSYRTLWRAEVTDIKALAKAVADGMVSPNCLAANMPVLNKLAEANKDTIRIPGVVFKSEKTVATRR